MNILADVDTVWKDFYTIEDIAGYNPIADHWLPIAFQDPALMHIFIGCADASTSGYTTTSKTTRGLRHLHAAIVGINQRLRYPPKVISVGTIGAVAALAMLEVRALIVKASSLCIFLAFSTNCALEKRRTSRSLANPYGRVKTACRSQRRARCSLRKAIDPHQDLSVSTMVEILRKQARTNSCGTQR